MNIIRRVNMGIKVNKKLIFFLGALGGLLYGYDMGVISGALLFIKDDIPLNSFTEGLVVASLLVGAIFGSCASGPMSDRLGRRRVVFIIALSPSMPLLVIGRLVIGLAVARSTAIVLLYLADMAHDDERGSLISLNQLMVTIGIVSLDLINDAVPPIEGSRWRLDLAL